MKSDETKLIGLTFATSSNNLQLGKFVSHIEAIWAICMNDYNSAIKLIYDMGGARWTLRFRLFAMSFTFLNSKL